MIEEFIYRMIDAKEDYKSGFFWDRSGTIIGTLFQSIFEDPINYYPFDPENPHIRTEE